MVNRSFSYGLKLSHKFRSVDVNEGFESEVESNDEFDKMKEELKERVTKEARKGIELIIQIIEEEENAKIVTNQRKKKPSLKVGETEGFTNKTVKTKSLPKLDKPTPEVKKVLDLMTED